MSQSSEHLKLEPSLPSDGLHRSQSCHSSGMWWNGTLKICTNTMLSSQRGPKTLRNVSSSLLNLSHEDLKQCLKPVPNRVYLTDLSFMAWWAGVSVGVGEAVISERSHLVNFPQAVLWALRCDAEEKEEENSVSPDPANKFSWYRCQREGERKVHRSHLI